MRLIVTGGHGFVGTHVLVRLTRSKHEVFAPKHADYELFNPIEVNQLFAFHPSDCVVHLAGLIGGIGFNGAHPALVLYENLMMALNIVNQASCERIPKLILVSSVCAYPKDCAVPFKEDALWDGYPEETNGPYGIAKRVIVSLAEAYRKEDGMNSVTLIPTNLYGPGDSFDLERCHVIPAMIRRFVEAKEANANTVVLWGTGQVTRDFLYVEDCADAIVKAATEPQPIEHPMNLGSGVEVRICDLAQMIADLVGWNGQIIWDSTKPDGQPRRCLDTSRAKQYLGWEATTTLKDGLEKTIKWYKENRSCVA